MVGFGTILYLGIIDRLYYPKSFERLIVNQITFKMSQMPKRLIVIVLIRFGLLNSSTLEMF